MPLDSKDLPVMVLDLGVWVFDCFFVSNKLPLLAEMDRINILQSPCIVFLNFAFEAIVLLLLFSSGSLEFVVFDF